MKALALLLFSLFALASCQQRYTCSCKDPDNEASNYTITTNSWDDATSRCSQQSDSGGNKTCEILEAKRKCY